MSFRIEHPFLQINRVGIVKQKIKVLERFREEVAIQRNRQLARESGKVTVAYLGISSTFSDMIISTPRTLAYPKFVLECRSRARKIAYPLSRHCTSPVVFQRIYKLSTV